MDSSSPAGPPLSVREAEARALAARLGARRMDELKGRIVDLSDPDIVWLVETGRVDVQVLAMRDGTASEIPQHLFEATSRFMMPGLDAITAPDGTRLTLGGRCSAGTVLWRTDRARLQSLELDLEALVAIEDWVGALTLAAAPPSSAVSTALLEADPDQSFPAQSVLCAPHETVVWTEMVSGVALAFGDEELRLEPGMAAWPLTERTWLELPGEAVVSGHLSPARMITGAVWADLDLFGRIVLRSLIRRRAARAADQIGRQSRLLDWTRTEFEGAVAGLAQAVDRRFKFSFRSAEAADSWAEAFAMVAEASGIAIPATMGRNMDVESVALAAGVSFRTVTLSADWWRGDVGPILGFLNTPTGATAVALLPRKPGVYEAGSTRLGARARVDAAYAARLAPSAIMLYRPLPARIKSLMDLLRFGMFGVQRDGVTIILMGLSTGLLGMAIPIATGFLMQSVLPRADLPLHLTVIAGLAAAAIANAAFSVVETVASMRIQAHIDLNAEAAVWNRLLRLRTSFFREHPTGDLADRANGVSEIRRAVTGVVTQSFLSGLFSLMSGILLVTYSLPLAMFAAVFTVVVVVIELVLFSIQLPRRRRQVASAGKVDTVAFETLSAMPKLRAAAAEPRAFARWSSVFAEQARLRRSATGVDNARAIINSVVPLAGSALLFAGVTGMLGSLFGGGGSAAAGSAAKAATAIPISFGNYIAFQAAFGAFLAGLLKLVGAFETIVGIMPVWERLRVILQAEQETGLGRTPIGQIRGSLQLSNVTFSYDASGPPVLDRLNLTIQAGEYVALVGPSGSGKSTVIRLLLGLEQPGSGAAYVDEHDLATVDLAAMRRQFGVVMQGGQITAGSILENILGNAPLTETAAWEAAKAAGLANDIWFMPMRMQTVLSEGGTDLSGGQRQRLLIARSLVRNPRVLLFDEATSALDNATQAAVQQTLDRLNVTRIVVAHRLSTIRDAHRIIVMATGRIAEEGRYDDLVARGGLFAQLVARQVA